MQSTSETVLTGITQVAEPKGELEGDCLKGSTKLKNDGDRPSTLYTYGMRKKNSKKNIIKDCFCVYDGGRQN